MRSWMTVSTRRLTHRIIGAKPSSRAVSCAVPAVARFICLTKAVGGNENA